MFIEEYFEKLNAPVPGGFLPDSLLDAADISERNKSIIRSFGAQLANNRAFTEKQRTLALRLLTMNSSALEEIGFDAAELITDITSPTFRHPARVLVQTMSITITTVDNVKCICFKAPFSDDFNLKLKKFKSQLPGMLRSTATWDDDTHSWIAELNENWIQFFISVMDAECQVDSEFEELANQVLKITEEVEQHIPLLTVENGNIVSKNTFKTIPNIATSNPVDALTQARRYGITCWDEKVDKLLVDKNVPPTLVRALVEPSPINYTKSVDISEIGPILNAAKTILIVIPGSMELQHLKEFCYYFNSNGISNDQMSVLFRPPNLTGASCNQYIRDNKLNNPLTSNTKVAFISGKLPRTVIDADVKFELLVSCGTFTAHYQLRNYIKNHPYVIGLGLQIKGDSIANLHGSNTR